MGYVDTLYVSKLGNAATAAASVGHSVFSAWMVFAMGYMYAVDFLISSSRGKGKLRVADQYFVQTIYACLTIVPVVIGIMELTRYCLNFMHIHPEVLPQANAYLLTLEWGLLPVIAFSSVRTYLLARESTLGVLGILILANILNAALNQAFIFGEYGFSARGLQGSALATNVSRWALFGMSAILLMWSDQKLAFKRDWRFHADKFLALFKLGFPLSVSLLLEVGVFALVTLFAGRLGPKDQAAHQITLNSASMTFMAITGVSAAASVLVGYYYGARNAGKMSQTGNYAILITTGFMSVSAVVFWFFPDFVLLPYTLADETREVAHKLLKIAAIFQLFDGLQSVLGGILRGTGNTAFSALVNAFGHWFLGFPISLYCLFYTNIGIEGLWYGLSAGLFFVSVALFIRWVIVQKRVWEEFN